MYTTPLLAFVRLIVYTHWPVTRCTVTACGTCASSSCCYRGACWAPNVAFIMPMTWLPEAQVGLHGTADVPYLRVVTDQDAVNASISVVILCLMAPCPLSMHRFACCCAIRALINVQSPRTVLSACLKHPVTVESRHHTATVCHTCVLS